MSIDRRFFSKEERDSMPDEDFAGPHQSFPIKSQQDVHNAAKLIGHAENPAAVKAAIKRIAKRKGFKLPESWEDEEDDGKDGDKKERSMEILRAVNADGSDGIELDSDGNHAKMKGKHSHKHHDNHGDDHTHDHEHNDDANHDHHHMKEAEDKKTEERAVAAVVETTPEITSESLAVYLPITRVDATERTVTGQATVEKPDAYGTIFGYCPEAWLKWRGNMREQHDPKKAVGRAIEVTPDPEERAIYVTSKVSRGAQDTWLKIEDGVLTGYSASIIPDPEFGGDPRKWPKKEYNGKEYPYLPRYTVAETSYVDNPATPGCNITVVRADGFVSEIIEIEENIVEGSIEEVQEPLERAGAKISADTKASMHKSIAHTLRAAHAQMKNCNCEDCQKAMKHIDPDDDNDVDLGGYDDPDGDWESLYGDGGSEDDMERAVNAIIERAVQPAILRLQSIAGLFAKNSVTNIDRVVVSSIERAVTSLEEKLEAKIADLPTQSSLDEVRAELTAVKGQVDKIAEQPMPGGPVLNAPAVEKRIPTDPIIPAQTQRYSYGAVYDAISQLARQGQLDSQDKQVDAMAAGLIAQRRRG